MNNFFFNTISVRLSWGYSSEQDRFGPCPYGIHSLKVIRFLYHNCDKKYIRKDQGGRGLGEILGALTLESGLQKASIRPITETWFRRMSGHHLVKGSWVSTRDRSVSFTRRERGESLQAGSNGEHSEHWKRRTASSKQRASEREAQDKAAKVDRPVTLLLGQRCSQDFV